MYSESPARTVSWLPVHGEDELAGQAVGDLLVGVPVLGPHPAVLEHHLDHHQPAAAGPDPAGDLPGLQHLGGESGIGEEHLVHGHPPAQRCTRPDPSPPASRSTSSRVARLMSPGMECLSAEAATA